MHLDGFTFAPDSVMGDSDDGGGLTPERRRVRPAGGHPLTHTAKTMLPKLRIILVAVLATCAAVLALSAGVVGARDPGNDLAGVPEVSRALVWQVIVAEPDSQLQLLAYSRRADELLRLRDLPLAPARAVVEYAEQAQARAAEMTSAPAPAATSLAESATAPASEPAPAVAATPTPPVDAPAADSAASATASADAPPPTIVAMAPVTSPHAETAAASPIAQPTSPAPIVASPPADTASAPADAATAPNVVPIETAGAGDTKIAAVAPGSSAMAEMYGPEKPKTDGKAHRRAKVVHPKPKKKPQVAAASTQPTPAATPAPSTGYPVNQPNNRNNGLGGLRYDSTAR
jgi:hypothetical protein